LVFRCCERGRAARRLLDWNQQRLADEAQVGIVTVRQLETGQNQQRRATLIVVQRIRRFH
jgi:hypothetical protein